MKEHHLALYRKYRPSTFKEVTGQEKIVTLLESTIKQKKISHAYLFSGGRGTGKTTVARIFADSIGCNPEDILEIDAASNRGIDEIRQLREAVRTAPFSSPYKVYIVDEAHMLTKEAANALLKTLEEPPRHVIFILATTDPEKLPQTIISRCQKISFVQPDIKTLSERLIFISKEEGYTLDKKSAELISKHSKGSYRDGLGILEQVLATSGKVVDYDDVVKILGTPAKDVLHELLEQVCTKNHAGIAKNINILQSNTTVALRTYDEFIEEIRQGLLIRIGEGEKSDKELERIATTYPHSISSKTILYLLEKRYLMEVSDTHAWTAFTAILFSLIEE